MGQIVNKRELSEILGISERSLSSWQEQPGFPIVAEAESLGRENQYDTAQVIQWWLQREIGKASPAEEERRRLITAQASLRELELAERAGKLVDAEGIAKDIRDGYRMTRNELLDFPARVAVLCVGKTQHQITTILDGEIRRVIDRLVERCRQMAAEAEKENE